MATPARAKNAASPGMRNASRKAQQKAAAPASPAPAATPLIGGLGTPPSRQTAAPPPLPGGGATPMPPPAAPRVAPVAPGAAVPPQATRPVVPIVPVVAPPAAGATPQRAAQVAAAAGGAPPASPPRTPGPAAGGTSPTPGPATPTVSNRQRTKRVPSWVWGGAAAVILLFLIFGGVSLYSGPVREATNHGGLETRVTKLEAWGKGVDTRLDTQQAELKEVKATGDATNISLGQLGQKMDRLLEKSVAPPPVAQVPPPAGPALVARRQQRTRVVIVHERDEGPVAPIQGFARPPGQGMSFADAARLARQR